MRIFAWITFLTGLLLSSIAGFYSVIGLAMIFSGAFMPVVILASTLELSKLVAVSWMYRYRHLAGRLIRVYFYAATIVLMCVTSMGIFGYLTRAHVESESGFATAQLTLNTITQREQAAQEKRALLNTELSSLTSQSNQLIAQLGQRERLSGTNGAVTVQRQTSARRQALLNELSEATRELEAIQRERINVTTETNKATADIGPLRYVAQAIYGTDDVTTVRKAVVWLTALLMIVFDPMAIMLLIAANILFTHQPTPVIQLPSRKPIKTIKFAPAVQIAASNPSAPPTAKIVSVRQTDVNSTDVPEPLLRV